MAAFEDVPLPGLGTRNGSLGGTSAPPMMGAARSYAGLLPPTARAVATFAAHVVAAPGAGCHIWCGSISSPDGYGRITWTARGVSRTLSAHRFALLIATGDPLADVVVEHRCNEPLCVRVDPAHVVPSTQSANMHYAVSCGRLRGPRPGPGDGRSRVDRSRALRTALHAGWDEQAYRAAAGVPPSTTGARPARSRNRGESMLGDDRDQLVTAREVTIRRRHRHPNPARDFPQHERLTAVAARSRDRAIALSMIA